MIHIRSLAGFPPPERPSLLTIGSFDGLHLGHQTLIRALVTAARERARQAVAVTFDPHPAIVLRGPRPAFTLTTPDEKAELFAALGLDLLLTHPFDTATSQLTASQFINPLRAASNFTEVWCGADFAFGHNREGNPDWLRAHGHTVHIVEPVQLNGAPISSSRIRRALAEGDIAEANACLGRPFALAGTVVEGDKRGRTIGIPTANLQIPEDRAFPARGVYACLAEVAGARLGAAANIGIRPTFGGDLKTVIEAHLLDFEGDLYGQTLRLHFVARLRAEQKFNGVKALAAQIQADIATARKLFQETEFRSQNSGALISPLLTPDS